VTGELRETLLGLASLWTGQTTAAAEGQSAPTLGPDSAAQDAIPPVVQQTKDLPPQTEADVGVRRRI